MLLLVMVGVLALFAFGFEGRLSPRRPDPSRTAAVTGRDRRSDRRTTHGYIVPVDRH